MSGGRLRAYQGGGEYIFASYCHKDEAAVLPLIGALAEAGVHVWFDEGIDPGEEWPQVIQKHVEGCTAFVAFVSAASQESHNCRKELNEAMTLGKPTIPVLLEDCERSRAIEMMLARLQAMKRWEWESAEECAAELACAIVKQHPSVQDDWPGQQVVVGRGAPDSTTTSPGGDSPKTKDAGDGGEAGENGLGSDLGGGTRSSVDEHGDGGDSDDEPLPGPKRKRIAAMVAVAALVVFAVLLVLFHPWIPPEQDDVVRVVLQPEEGVSVRDFNADVDTVRNRLDLFVGEGGYSMVAGPSTVTVELPKSCLGDLEVKNALRCYITRPVNLYLAEAYSVKDSDGSQPIDVARSDILSVTVEDGPVAGLESAASAAGLPSDCKVIRMELTDEFIAQNDEVIDGWGEDLILAQDITYSSSFYYGPVVRDGNALYFLDKDQDENPNIPQVVAYNYTHDALRGSIMFTVSLDDRVSWEEPGEGAFRGENQVSSRELEGKLVILRYSDDMHANVENITEGAQLDLETGLKMRFDALDVPYAFGYVDEELDGGGTARYAAFKAPWDSVSSRYAYMLAACGSGDLAIRAQDCQTNLYPNTHSVSIGESEGGAWRIVVAGKGAANQAIAPSQGLAMFGQRLEAGDDVSFMLGNYVALKANYAGTNDESFLSFDNVATVEGQPVGDADAQRAAEFYATCLETWERMPSGLQFKGGEVDEDGLLSETQSMKVEQIDEYDQIEQSVTKAVPGASVNLEQPYVKVQLDLPVDGSLAYDGLQAARKVFEVVGCRHAEFPNIIVYLVDEDRVKGNMARIQLARTVNWSDGSFILTVSKSIQGEQVEGYEDDFTSIMRDDALFSTYLRGIDVEEFERALSVGFLETTEEGAAGTTDASQGKGISYKSRYFELTLPASWDGRWETEHGHEFREAMSATNYFYSFKLDGVAQFSIECKEYDLNSAASVGSTGERQVEFYPADALPHEDADFIRDSIKVIQE